MNDDPCMLMIHTWIPCAARANHQNNHQSYHQNSVGQVRYGWLFSDQIRCSVTNPRECIAGEL